MWGKARNAVICQSTKNHTAQFAKLIAPYVNYASSKKMIVTAQQLLENPLNTYRHVVLLGAGASRAAFPDGDASGRCVPLMSDLMSAINLLPLFDKAGIEIGDEGNFEVIYGRLFGRPEYADTMEEVERRIEDYFSGMSLPNRATIYDRILVSLRPTDAVFTFNWDPFLFDAYRRNCDVVPLPEIFFLHGNTRIGACRDHDRWGARGVRCPDCRQLFSDVPLCYPIPQKDYSEPYVCRSWETAKMMFSSACTITIFGYGAPDSDKSAVDLLERAWFNVNSRTLGSIEIINTEPSSILEDRWSRFTPTLHYQIRKTFEESRIACWPRRTCESLRYRITKGVLCEEFPIPNTDSLMELQAHAASTARYEES